MVDAEIIRWGVEYPNATLGYLGQAQASSFEVFWSDTEGHTAVERNLHLVLKALNDIASRVVAGEGLGTVEQAQDLSSSLGTPSVGGAWPDRRSAPDRCHDMIGFRNVLLHDDE